MITLHRKENNSKSNKLEEKLNNMVISFKIVEHEPKEEGLPFIEEDGVKYNTEEEIQDWISELDSELKWQRSLSGDGCYINPEDGTVC